MKSKLSRILSQAIAWTLVILFLAYFAGPAFLRLYIRTGIGDCRKIPILCMWPDRKLDNLKIDAAYHENLIPHRFNRMSISAPRGFSVVQELIKKIYYKKRKGIYKDCIIYVIYQEPGYFVKLYPRMEQAGIKDNYDFIRRTMYAKTANINGLTDMFFVIMKSIFIPDLGDQTKVVMSEFTLNGLKGFLSYSLSEKNNYFDFNIIDRAGGFYKVYIRDKGMGITLSEAFTIISTVARPEAKSLAAG
jgi:hypothetical protein